MWSLITPRVNNIRRRLLTLDNAMCNNNAKDDMIHDIASF